jgi:hypothetical protein
MSSVCAELSAKPLVRTLSIDFNDAIFRTILFKTGYRNENFAKLNGPGNIYNFTT